MSDMYLIGVRSGEVAIYPIIAFKSMGDVQEVTLELLDLLFTKRPPILKPRSSGDGWIVAWAGEVTSGDTQESAVARLKSHLITSCVVDYVEVIE